MHRVIKGFMVQGGDFTKFNGTGGESIYGGRFEDEDLSGLHDRAGLLSMANAGKNTNGSQFFITCAPYSHLNGAHVVFGELMAGKSVLRIIEREPVDEQSHRPGLDVKVTNCGELKPEEYIAVSEFQSSKKRRRERSPSPDSSSSSSDDEHRRKADRSKEKRKHHKKSKHEEKEKEKDDDDEEKRTRDRAPSESNKKLVEPPQPRIDAKGREVKGRGSIRGNGRPAYGDRRDERRRDQQHWTGPHHGHPRDDRHYGHGGRESDSRRRRDMDDEMERYARDRDGSRREDPHDHRLPRGMPLDESRRSPPNYERRERSDWVQRDADERRRGDEPPRVSEPAIPQRTLVSYSGVVAPPSTPSSRGTKTASPSRSESMSGMTSNRQTSPEVQRKTSPQPERKGSPSI